MNTIYQITNTVNGKTYIGQTWQPLAARWRKHKASKRQCKLTSAFKSYGIENFMIEAICQTDNQSDADSLEIFLIATRETITNGYNHAIGGVNNKPTDESRKKISEALKGRTLPESTRQKMSSSRMGRLVSFETRKKISEAKMGHTHNLGLKYKKRSA